MRNSRGIYDRLLPRGKTARRRFIPEARRERPAVFLTRTRTRARPRTRVRAPGRLQR
jgi:hypothetical protein